MTKKANHKDQYFGFIKKALEDVENVDSELIRERCAVLRDKLGSLYPLTNNEFEELIVELEGFHSIRKSEISVVQGETINYWIPDDFDFPRWERYQRWKTMTNPHFPIADLHHQTKLILNHCVDPTTKEAWDIKGMVVGHVQSGKTANYVGLINRALDAGYKVVIVLAGIHNSLREQTQGRIDSGVIGRESTDFVLNSSSHSWIGVGELDQSHAIQCLTSKPYRANPNSKKKVGGDFNKKMARGQNTHIGGEDPWIFVIKKNKSVLENLISWLGGFRTGENMKLPNLPALIIDDEADHASVNSGDKDDPKTINRLVRSLASLFEKSTFIGYTATPYANMFIPEDWDQNKTIHLKNGGKFELGKPLFPGDFIVNIHPGSNYMGPEVVFGRDRLDEDEKGVEGIDIFVEVDDAEPPKGTSGGPYIPLKQTSTTELPEALPDSLKAAIHSFVVVVACRMARGQAEDHNSMLINVAYRVVWIDEIAWLVSEYVKQLLQGVMTGDGHVEKVLLDHYSTEFLHKTEAIKDSLQYDDPVIQTNSIEEVKKHLKSALEKIKVYAVHGRSKGMKVAPLDLNYSEYNSGLSVIAIGGGKLSRGLTLEGLSISYFLRTTRMYDSLMQMGRWFGYRPGYADLCRIYTTDQLRKNFKFITMATEEVRQTFTELTLLKKRPRDFQLKVRTDVTGAKLLITSPNRMRESWLQSSTFGGKIIQTYQFLLAPEAQRKNFQLCQKVISSVSLDPIHRRSGSFKGFLGKGLDSMGLIKLLYQWNHTESQRRVFNGALDYWKKQIEVNSELSNCSVYIPSSSKRSVGKMHPKVLGSKFCNLREKDSPLGFDVSHSKGVFRVQTFFRSLFSNHQDYLETTGNNAILDKPLRIADCEKSDLAGDQLKEDLLRQRSALGPLIVLLPLNSRIDNRLDEGLPLLGLGIIFPHLEGEIPVQYAVNQLIDWEDDAVFDSDDTSDDE